MSLPRRRALLLTAAAPRFAPRSADAQAAWPDRQPQISPRTRRRFNPMIFSASLSL